MLKEVDEALLDGLLSSDNFLPRTLYKRKTLCIEVWSVFLVESCKNMEYYRGGFDARRGRKMEKRYQVFISSTFADLEDERKGVMEAIIELDCSPAGMEMFPASNKEQFEYIKSVIDESDYYVIIVAGRYGSIADDGISYTEKEFDYAKEKGIPILAFVKKDISTLTSVKIELDSQKRECLQKFREKVLDGRMAKFWDTKDELKYNLHSSLSHEMKINPKVGWIRGNTAVDMQLYDKLEKIREERDYYKKLYLEALQNKDTLDNSLEERQRDDFETKLKAKFIINFKTDHGTSYSTKTSIIDILQTCAVLFFSEIDADMLKGGIEMLYERDGLKLKLEYQSLSTILLKLLALNIIESDC